MAAMTINSVITIPAIAPAPIPSSDVVCLWVISV